MAVLRDYNPNEPTTTEQNIAPYAYGTLEGNVASDNVLLQGATLRTATAFGRTATVKAGEPIQPAINSLKSAGGGTLILLAGVHKLTAAIELASNIKVFGEGKDSTIIDATAVGKAFNVDAGSFVTLGGTGMTITSNSVTVTGTSTDFTLASPGQFVIYQDTAQRIASIESATSLTLEEAWGNNTIIVGVAPNNYIAPMIVNASISDLTIKCDSGTSYGIYIDLAVSFILSNVDVHGAATGVYVTRSISTVMDRVAAINCTGVGIDFYNNTKGNYMMVDTRNNGSYGIRYEGTGDLLDVFLNCHALGNISAGFYINNTGGAKFIHCTSNSNTTSASGFYLNNASGCTFFGCSTSLNDYGFNQTGTSDSNIFLFNSASDSISGFKSVTTSGTTVMVGNLGFTGTLTAYDIGTNPNMTAIGNSRPTPTLIGETLYMKNTSGATIAAGEVVTLKAIAAANEVTTTTTLGDDTVLGMMVASTTNNSTGTVITLGKVDTLKVDGTTDIAVGDFLCTFTTAGIAAKATAGDMAFAIALEAYTTNDSNGVIDALLIKPRKL